MEQVVAGNGRGILTVNIAHQKTPLEPSPDYILSGSGRRVLPSRGTGEAFAENGICTGIVLAVDRNRLTVSRIHHDVIM